MEVKKAILIRTSTEEQNPENQLKDIESIAGTDYVLFEEQQSAWKDKDRPIFESLKKQIAQHKITDLYVWDLDRLYRNRKKIIEFFQYAKNYGVTIHSYRQGWLNDLSNIQPPFNEIMFNLMLQIMGWLAEDESNKKSQRVKISIRKENGITKSYKGNKWGRKQLPLSTKQAIIDAYNQNKSYSQICNEVFYWDSARNKKYVSKGIVHKIINEFKMNK